MVDDLCALRDMGDCAGALRPTVIGINGVLRRLVVCHGHYAFLGEHSTPLRAAPPKPTGTEDTAGERPARTKMITPAGQFVAACLLRDGRRLPWPTVRVVMESYGIKPGKGRLPGTKIRDVRAAVESSGLPEGVTAEAPTGTHTLTLQSSPDATYVEPEWENLGHVEGTIADGLDWLSEALAQQGVPSSAPLHIRDIAVELIEGSLLEYKGRHYRALLA